VVVVCRELENCRDAEINEMIDIYVDRGMSQEDAEVSCCYTSQPAFAFMLYVTSSVIRTYEKASVLQS
jgi:hypothetical protein